MMEDAMSNVDVGGVREDYDDDVEWLVSEVHMVHEIPAAAADEAAGGELHLSRFPLYALDEADVEGAEDYSGTEEEEEEGGETACVDDEGDLVVPRRGARCTARRQRRPTAVVTLLHTLRSTLPAVGLQVRMHARTHAQASHDHARSWLLASKVWRGSLVLAEYVMREQDAGRWHGVHALELGAGVGLAGLIMARHASRVWFTGKCVRWCVCVHHLMLTRFADYDEEVLSICEKNTRLNRHLFAHDDVARVRKLNWLTPPSFASAEGLSLSLLSSATMRSLNVSGLTPALPQARHRTLTHMATRRRARTNGLKRMWRTIVT
jgi:hypothetical protein